MAQTLRQYIDGVLDEYGDVLHATFAQNKVEEVGGTYTVEIIWISEDEISPSNIPSLDATSVPLTEAEEYTVQPTIKAVTNESVDDVLDYNIDPLISLSDHKGRVEDSAIDAMAKAFSEVHMDESELVEFVEQGEGTDGIVEFVEVYSFDAPRQNATRGIYFFIELRLQHHYELDGLLTDGRFDHVDTLTIDGQAYPVIIDVDLTNSEGGSQGQWIHTSEFVAEHTEAAKVNLSEELDRIDWAEFFASGRPVPEQPGAPSV